MLHYNMPSFALGRKPRPSRGPWRCREVGHGYLAALAAKPNASVRKSNSHIPFAFMVHSRIRWFNLYGNRLWFNHVIDECGVPIRKMVGGTAMGLLQNSKTKTFQTLTDISWS